MVLNFDNKKCFLSTKAK